jgi:hypothetical protein
MLQIGIGETEAVQITPDLGHLQAVAITVLGRYTSDPYQSVKPFLYLRILTVSV